MHCEILSMAHKGARGRSLLRLLRSIARFRPQDRHLRRASRATPRASPPQTAIASSTSASIESAGVGETAVGNRRPALRVKLISDLRLIHSAPSPEQMGAFRRCLLR